ncbi:ABC transporter substrate-binding protein [Actinocatenispora thailandica]|uniref:ABC transporter substrate-binding protein n=1 Tax=Actinocatenispora thailandica TaxID=227318 RepID=A0A7R7DKA5_9ACTN|nr:ABC transporter permease [Actinocatenispora thailandica]BCJ33295.1 ABC transporter substrate-binding protein [Actinocatenispora thailandica]
MYLALRDLRFARGRFALIGAVVAMIAVLGVILSGLASGLADSGVSGLRGLPVTHLAFDKSATGELFSRSTVTKSTWQAWASQPGVRRAEPLGQQLVHARRVGAGDQQLDLAVFGVEPGGFLAPAPVSGRPLSAAPNGVLISEDIAKQGIAIGDRLSAGQAGTELTVVGTIGHASFGHVGVVYAPLPLWQRLHYGLPGPVPAAATDQATAVALQLAPGADPAAADRRLGTRTVDKSGSYAASPGYTAESSTMTLIRGFLYAISALVVGSFFTVWTIQRRQEIALLKAIGAGTGYLLRDALTQVTAVLLVATAAGTAVGVALGRAMNRSAPFSLDAGQLLVAAAALIVLGLAGAAVAVRRITRVQALTALGANR